MWGYLKPKTSLKREKWYQLWLLLHKPRGDVCKFMSTTESKWNNGVRSIGIVRGIRSLAIDRYWKQWPWHQWRRVLGLSLMGMKILFYRFTITSNAPQKRVSFRSPKPITFKLKGNGNKTKIDPPMTPTMYEQQQFIWDVYQKEGVTNLCWQECRDETQKW